MIVDIKPIIGQSNRLQLLPQLKLTDKEYNIMSAYCTISTHVWTGSVDCNLCCILGAIADDISYGKAYVWFFHTSEFDRYKFVFARRSPEIIRSLLWQYPHLVGHCVRSNKSAQRWIKWLGAKFEEAGSELIPWGIEA